MAKAARACMQLACLLLTACCLSSPSAASDRRNAVFVLGGDDEGQIGFFTAATRFHRQRLDRGDLLVTTARTWAEVREWLARSDKRSDQPWGRIVLVAHGSQWTGLALPLFDSHAESPRASELRAVIAQQLFPPLPLGIVDGQTELLIESCGIGRRPELLALYANLLAGASVNLEVQSSAHLVEFSAPVTETAGESTRTELEYEVKITRPQRAATQPLSIPSGWSALPINVEMPISSEHCGAGRADRLAKLPAIRDALADYDLTANRLRWSTVRDDRGCTLIGHAMVLTSAPQAVREIRN